MSLPLNTTPGLLPKSEEPSKSPSTRFAFRLFQELVGGGDGNIFFSPASVMLCLSMVHELASGETRQAMAKALEIADLDPIDAQLARAALKSLFVQGSGVTLTAANSLWCNHGTQVRPEIAANLRSLYDAEFATLDFAADDAVSRINAWISGKTNGMINRILDTLPQLAVLVAINAIYFNGRWSRPFKMAETKKGTFTTANGSQKQLPMMSQSGTYRYCEDQQMQAVALPYQSGVTMYVVLPVEQSEWHQFQRSLTSGLWESWLTGLKSTPGTIRLPRFKLDYFARLEPALKALGMERAFDQNRAEFDGILTDKPPAWIDQVLHRVVAEVNEEGTEAAATTTTTMRGFFAETPPPPRPFEMTVDRPFFVVIRGGSTGTILFMGWIGDPQ